MFKRTAGICLCALSSTITCHGGAGPHRPLIAQVNPVSPAVTASAVSPIPNLPPGVGPQSLPDSGAVGAPPLPPMPNEQRGVGARPMPPRGPVPASGAFENVPGPVRQKPSGSESGTPSLISFLDSTAPYVQAFDFVLMLIAGLFCLRARKARGLTIMAISCFVSAVILLGFFLFAISHGHGVFPQAAYIVARILAPFELLLFAIAIILVARKNPAP